MIKRPLLIFSLLLFSVTAIGATKSVAETPKIPLESLFQMISPSWSNADLKTGRALDEFLDLSLNSDENAIAYNLPSTPKHIMKSYHGGPGTYYFGVPIILDIEKDGRRFAQCALIYKYYYLERRDQRLFDPIGCDNGFGEAHPEPKAFLQDLEANSVSNCGPGCRYHFVSSQSPDKAELVQEIKELYLDEVYNYDMVMLPKEPAKYKVSYSVYGGGEFQSVEFEIVEEQVKGVASTFTIYRLLGPWQNHAALRYGADKNLYFQYYDQAPLGVMEVLERDGELRRDIQLYVIADGQIIAHQDVSETLNRSQSIDEDTKPQYKRKKPGLRYDGLDGRGGNIFIGGKDQFHHLLESHKGDVHFVWSEKTDRIEFARAWTFNFSGKTIIPEDRQYALSGKLRLEAGNGMSQDRNSDRYFWSVASETGASARKLIAAAQWIPDPVRLEREATEARMQADRDRREQERAERKAQIAADNAARDARHEQHLSEVAAREKAVDGEVAIAQATAMAKANAELAKAQKMLKDAHEGAASNSGFLVNWIRYFTCWGLLLGGVLYSRALLSAKLPALGTLLDRSYSLVGALLPPLGVALAASGLLGLVMNTLSGAVLANFLPQLTALALGVVLGSSKMLNLKATAEAAMNNRSTISGSDAAAAGEAPEEGGAKLGYLLSLVNENKEKIGLAAIAAGLVNLVSGGALYVI
ncbi:MAG: cell envelope integrity protein TolA [Pseudomonadota bacterium]